MARTPDLARRQELLDQVVDHLARTGLSHVTLRPLAAALGVSINRLVHHFGSKEDLIAAAVHRCVERQEDIQARWLRRHPDMTMADWYRKWWKWMLAAPENLALVRLGYEASALDSTVTGLPGPLRADQMSVWRLHGEMRLRHDGMTPAAAAAEASLMKALFTGLVAELVATGDRRRLGRTLEMALQHHEQRVARSTHAAGEQVDRVGQSA